MCFETQLARFNIKLQKYLLPRARCGELPLLTELPRRLILGNSASGLAHILKRSHEAAEVAVEVAEELACLRSNNRGKTMFCCRKPSEVLQSFAKDEERR